MSYATKQQLIDRYGEEALIGLTDRAEPPAGVIDDDVLARALADADAVIDGYLAGRYALPLATTPALIVDLAQAIAIHKLHRQVVPEKIDADYKDALRMLRDIAGGVIRLSVAGVEPAASGASGVRTSDRVRDLTPDNLRGFI